MTNPEKPPVAFDSARAAIVALALLIPCLGLAIERAGRITPEPKGKECHQMSGPCPAGWYEKEPAGRKAEDDSEATWVECCQKDEEFKPLPPQPHQKFPICDPKTREEWLAVGIEFERNCDLRYTTCAIMYREEAPPAPPAPEALPLEPAPPPKRLERVKALPEARVIAMAKGDPGERSEAVAVLIKGLSDESPAGRERSALALAARGSRAASALEDLLPILKSDPSPRVRACAVVATASIGRGNLEIESSLTGALSDPHAKVRSTAAQALKFFFEELPADAAGPPR